jgi:hypothetical protein
LIDQPADTIRRATAALLADNFGLDGNAVLNGELDTNGRQHEGCDDALTCDSPHVPPAALVDVLELGQSVVTAQTSAPQAASRQAPIT